MKLFLITLFLITGRVVFSQSYELLHVINASAGIHDFEINTSSHILYVSTGSGIIAYNLVTDTQKKVEVIEGDSKRDTATTGNKLFSKGAAYLVSYSRYHPTLFVYKLTGEKYKLHATFNTTVITEALTISDNGLIAAGSYDGEVRIWDILQKQFVRMIQANTTGGYVSQVNFGKPGSNTIFVDNGEATAIDFEKQSITASWKFGFYPTGPESSVGQNVIQFTPTDMDSIVAMSMANQMFNALYLWNLHTGKQTLVPVSEFQPKCFDRKGDDLIVAGTDGKIYTYNLTKRAVTNIFATPQCEINKLKLSASGNYMVTSGKDKIYIFKRTISSPSQKTTSYLPASRLYTSRGVFIADTSFHLKAPQLQQWRKIEEGLMHGMMDSIYYPAMAREAGSSSVFICSFKVRKDGAMSDFRTEKQGFDGVCKKGFDTTNQYFVNFQEVAKHVISTQRLMLKQLFHAPTAEARFYVAFDFRATAWREEDPPYFKSLCDGWLIARYRGVREQPIILRKQNERYDQD